MQAKNIPKYDPQFQKVVCIADALYDYADSVLYSAFLVICLIYTCKSLLDFEPDLVSHYVGRIGTSVRILGLKRYSRGPDAVSMTVSS